jgi:hypothetical protein
MEQPKGIGIVSMETVPTRRRQSQLRSCGVTPAWPYFFVDAGYIAKFRGFLRLFRIVKSKLRTLSGSLKIAVGHR